MILLINDHGCEETDSAQLWGDWNCWADTWMDCTVFLPGNDDDDEEEEEDVERGENVQQSILITAIVIMTAIGEQTP